MNVWMGSAFGFEKKEVYASVSRLKSLPVASQQTRECFSTYDELLLSTIENRKWGKCT